MCEEPHRIDVSDNEVAPRRQLYEASKAHPGDQ
jgi:hypothetical protein